MRPLNEEEIEYFRTQNLDPTGYVADDESGQFILAEEPAEGSRLKEAGKSLIRGAGAAAAAPFGFSGRVADLIREYAGGSVPGDVGSDPRSILTQTAEGIRGFANELAPADPNIPRGFWSHDLPEGAGQLAGALGTGGLFTRLLGKGLGRATAAGAAASMEAEDTAQRAEDLGQGSGTAVLKGLGAGMGGRIIENALGAGRLFGKMVDPITSTTKRTFSDFVKNRLGDAAAGAGGEGLQRLLQDYIVEQKPSWNDILREAAVGGILQSGVGGAVDAVRRPGETAVESDTFEDEGETADIDVTKTPWKTQPLTAEYRTNLKTSEKWEPVISTDFDTAINEAKKRNILTDELIDKLYESNEPNKTLDDLVRQGVQPQRVVKPLSDAELDGLRKITADDKPPVMTPLLRGVIKARKGNLGLRDEDYQLMSQFTTNQKVDEFLTAKFYEAKQQEKQMTAAQVVDDLREKKYTEIRKVLPTEIGNIEKMDKNIQALGKQLEKADLPAGQRWELEQQFAKMQREVDTLRVDTLQKWLSVYETSYTPPDPNQIHRPVGLPPDLPSTSPQLMPGVPPVEGEQGLPFVESGSTTTPPTPESSEQLNAQLQLTADPNSTKAVTLVTPGEAVPSTDLPSVETPHGIAIYNPEKVDEQTVVQAGQGDRFDGRLLGMADSGQQPVASQTAVTTSVGSIPDVIAEVVPAGKEEAAIQAQQSAVPGGTTEVKPARDVVKTRMAEKYLKDGFVLTSISELDAARPYGLDLNKSGNIPTGNLVNRMRNTMPKAEFGMYEKAGLAEWLKDKKEVTREQLAEWLSANGPQLEVRKLRATPNFSEENEILTTMRQEVTALRHALDTKRPGWYNEVDTRHQAEWSKDVVDLFNAYVELDEQLSDSEAVASSSATYNYQQVNPKPLDQMPGAVDVLVRVPSSDDPTDPRTLFLGSHFASEDINILGWARMYEETLPDGAKVFHVFEVQSDWGQRVRKENNQLRRVGIGEVPASLVDRGSSVQAGHPLLPDYNRLAIKAAIKHALENNADFIAISDAETAMLTEMHDQYLEEGKLKQESGMRLNYDKVLPEIMEELTGYKGTMVDFGEHQNALTERESPFGRAGGAGQLIPRSNLIFKNPDGTPKTNITARMYPLAAVRKAESVRKGFSLFGKDKVKFTRAQMQAETGLSPDDLSPTTDFHSGFSGSHMAGVWKMLTKHADPLKYWHGVQRSVKNVLTRSGESGAYLSAWLRPLHVEQMRLKNVAIKSAEKYRKLLSNAAFKKWANEAASTGVEDYNKLPPELRAQAKRLRKHLTAYQNIQNREGILVQELDLAGNRRLRPAKQLPGWFPFRVKDKVYQDLRIEENRRKRKAEWMRNAQRHISNRPNWKEQAEAAFNKFQQVNVRPDAVGEPLFKAVDTEHSWPLPEEWRDTEDMFGGLLRYADKWSKHIAWEKIIGKNPILRKILNIAEGPAGERTDEDAPKPWAEAATQYATAVAQGRRVEAPWVENIDLNKTIEPLGDTDSVNLMIASYAQKPIGRFGIASETLNAGSQLTGSMLMQTVSGLRDLGTSATGVWSYIPMKDMGKALDGFVDAIVHPVQTIKKAQMAGAAPADVFTLQTGTPFSGDTLAREDAYRVAAKVMYKAAQAVRTVTGRNFLDAWGRAIVYNTVAEVSKYNKKHGIPDTLMQEFVPREVLDTMTPQQQIDATAAAVVERIAPNYNAESLPAGMLPQNRNFWSAALSLLKFPVSRFNNWYEDEWRPALNGKPQRLIKSLLVVGLSSQIIGELIAFLSDRRPQELTWAEYLRMPKGTYDEKDIAASFFYNLQMNGYYGMAGEAANLLARRYADRPINVERGVSLAYPPYIVFGEAVPKVLSFMSAVESGTVGLDDIKQLGWELAALNQNYKVYEAWADAKPEYRDKMIFEQLYGLSPITAEPVNKRERMSYGTPDPFSLNNRLMRVDDEGDIERLMPLVEDRANPIQVRPQLMSDEYYQEVAMRRGEKEAQKQYEDDWKREKMREYVQDLK